MCIDRNLPLQNFIRPLKSLNTGRITTSKGVCVSGPTTLNKLNVTWPMSVRCLAKWRTVLLSLLITILIKVTPKSWYRDPILAYNTEILSWSKCVIATWKHGGNIKISHRLWYVSILQSLTLVHLVNIPWNKPPAWSIQEVARWKAAYFLRCRT